jgi:predicted RNase H-like HicB family nuclease
MAKYVFPAVFTQEENGYSVKFPDVQGCYTDADTLPEALERAEDVLQMMLADAEENGMIPTPTPIKNIPTDSRTFVVPILCDTANEAFAEGSAAESVRHIDLMLDMMLEMLKSGQTSKVIELLEQNHGRMTA